MRHIMEKGHIKEAIDELVLKIEDMSDDQFRDHLKSVRQFHNYSMCNIILIKCQVPTASIVASCKKWNAIGRSIIRGEKSIRILAPTVRKFKKTKITDGQEVTEEDQRIGFIDVPVFDISQTEGKALDSIKQINGVIDETTYNNIVLTLEKELYTIVYKPLEYALGGHIEHGFYITLNSNLSMVENFSTLLHELAHSKLKHQSDRKSLTRQQKELEAEATAYLLGQYFGLDIKSEFYLKSWGGDSKKLLQSLNCIMKSYKEIISIFEGDTNGRDQGHTQEIEVQDSSKPEPVAVC